MVLFQSLNFFTISSCKCQTPFVLHGSLNHINKNLKPKLWYFSTLSNKPCIQILRKDTQAHGHTHTYTEVRHGDSPFQQHPLSGEQADRHNIHVPLSIIFTVYWLSQTEQLCLYENGGERLTEGFHAGWLKRREETEDEIKRSLTFAVKYFNCSLLFVLLTNLSHLNNSSKDLWHNYFDNILII